MAAFTTFSDAALERYLMMFDMGELEKYEPIEGGIENSNYYVTLQGDSDSDSGAREFVLTITEGMGFDDVPFFNELFRQLDSTGLPVPVPERTLDGMASTIFCGKPAWLFPRLPGIHPTEPTPEQCETIGAALARLHEGAASARYSRHNSYDAAWAKSTLEAIGSALSTQDHAMLQSILAEYAQFADADLPRGIIHGDLFRDNTLFDAGRLTGIIDFYHACDDFLVQDVAITVNDWCTNPDGSIDDVRCAAMIDGYESVRALTEAEVSALPAFRRAGAMRFVLTRLLSGDAEGHLKDPEEFLRIARGAQSPQ
ncbi:MAG TPA: homoserine kinase [Pseudomonadales bacterium]|nr:homoserine kinase [Pseudomonadales bacterium]